MKRIFFIVTTITILECYFNCNTAFAALCESKVKVHLQDETVSTDSETIGWLRDKSQMLKDIEDDLGTNDNSEIHLPAMTSREFLALKDIIKNEIIPKGNNVSFHKICKKPTIKKLIDILYATEFLTIDKLQDAITDEIAHRYYKYPSLARRHAEQNGRNEKYLPLFKNTRAETLVAQKIIASSKEELWTKNIECLQIIGQKIEREKTNDNWFIGKAHHRYGVKPIWDSATNQLLEHDGGGLFSDIPVVCINGTKILTWDGSKTYKLKDLQDNCLKQWKASRFTREFYYLDSVSCTPDNSVIIACDPTKIGFSRPNVTKENSKKFIKILEVNPSDYPQHENYGVTFGNYPCITNDFLIFKHRLGIKKLNLITEELECFDFIPYKNKNDEVSAVALTPDNGHILVGMCESTCKTYIKILDFVTGAIVKTIDINTHEYCEATNSYPGEKWPYENITSIVPTPDGTKIIISSRFEKTKIIDFNTGSLLQEFHIDSDKAALGITSDGTKIIIGPNPTMIYGNLLYERLTSCLENSQPLPEILKVLGIVKCTRKIQNSSAMQESPALFSTKIKNLVSKISTLIV